MLSDILYLQFELCIEKNILPEYAEWQNVNMQSICLMIWASNRGIVRLDRPVLKIHCKLIGKCSKFYARIDDCDIEAGARVGFVAGRRGLGVWGEWRGVGVATFALIFASNFLNYQFQRQLSSERINKYINKRNTWKMEMTQNRTKKKKNNIVKLPTGKIRENS